MADLKVDYDQLTASGDALGTLRSEFEHASELADETSGIWGNGHVADAMHSFSHNWKIHRTKLVEKMQKVQEMTEGCVRGFEDADGKIAAGVQVRHGGGAR